MQYLSEASRRVDEFVRSQPRFKSSCDAAFDLADVRGTGRVGRDQVAVGAAQFFKDLRAALSDYGLHVSQPSAAEIRRVLQEGEDSGGNSSRSSGSGATLDRAQFEDVYLRLLKYAAVKAAEGAARKYGLAVAAATAALLVARRAARAVPLLGGLVAPLLAPFVVGPLVGVLGVHCYERGGDLSEVRRALFGGDGGGAGAGRGGGQFKAG